MSIFSSKISLDRDSKEKEEEKKDPRNEKKEPRRNREAESKDDRTLESYTTVIISQR